MVQTAFNYLVVDQVGRVKGGFDDYRLAVQVAENLKLEVKENVLTELTGLLRLNTTDATLDGIGMGAAIAEAMGLQPTRNSAREVGYVRIIIKPASVPDKTTEPDYGG